MEPQEPIPVKLICGILYSDEALLQAAFRILNEQFGHIDFTSPVFPFSVTDYYVAEMGTPIRRLFCSFRDLINPGALAAIKITCNRIEEEVALQGLRKVNLDPGYMDYDKMVLASAKYNAHKIYLDQGIYADLTLRYERGVYQPAPYAFPDFKTGQYNETFLRIRANYKGQVRKWLRQGAAGL